MELPEEWVEAAVVALCHEEYGRLQAEVPNEAARFRSYAHIALTAVLPLILERAAGVAEEGNECHHDERCSSAYYIAQAIRALGEPRNDA